MSSRLHLSWAFQVILAGGTGSIGQGVASKLDEAIILTRNSFLASAPNRVTEQFGWVGERYLQKNQHVRLRDWDGGDLLDIVGKDWVGWQDDALTSAHVIVHLVGGYTAQRTMACERLVRESFRFCPNALHITVSPSDEDMAAVAPSAAVSLKTKRVQECEEMVKANCKNCVCIRIEAFNEDAGVEKIVNTIEEWTQKYGEA